MMMNLAMRIMMRMMIMSIMICSVFDFDGWVYDGDEVDNDEDDYKVQETVYNNAEEEEFNEVDIKVDGNDEVITG